jgi:hypothetical protein
MDGKDWQPEGGTDCGCADKVIISRSGAESCPVSKYGDAVAHCAASPSG